MLQSNFEQKKFTKAKLSILMKLTQHNYVHILNRESYEIQAESKEYEEARTAQTGKNK